MLKDILENETAVELGSREEVLLGGSTNQQDTCETASLCISSTTVQESKTPTVRIHHEDITVSPEKTVALVISKGAAEVCAIPLAPLK